MRLVLTESHISIKFSYPKNNLSAKSIDLDSKIRKLIYLHIFLLTELCSQLYNVELLRTVRRSLPTGIHYMTGKNADIREEIIPTTGTLFVLEKIEGGTIMAIIDANYILRKIYLGDEHVAVQPDGYKFTLIPYMSQNDLEQYNIVFNKLVIA